MLHYRAVQDLVNRLGYPETTLWVQENRHEYLGVSRGFLIAE